MSLSAELVNFSRDKKEMLVWLLRYSANLKTKNTIILKYNGEQEEQTFWGSDIIMTLSLIYLWWLLDTDIVKIVTFIKTFLIQWFLKLVEKICQIMLSKTNILQVSKFHLLISVTFVLLKYFCFCGSAWRLQQGIDIPLFFVLGTNLMKN